jgi:hypothetical protein
VSFDGVLEGVLADSGGFLWVLVKLWWVLVGSVGVLVGSGGFWCSSGGFWSDSCVFL